ncbi:MAG: GlsB/YeaQ/YmgE family stress response membrane protein [Pirellulaceae bacterium]|jgi:uncharacterized membrane protein YeaQ/YmgE (transglycosylase-associated protein family)|nr:GlsB/YeaQ/YmgE family stress response membrane protein [Pirellulaceae bacterium]
MNFELLSDYGNIALTWIGFGTILGLIAMAVMPGREPGGTLATLMMGIAGTLIGCAILKFFYPLQDIRPLSIEGFSAGVGGAFVLLLFYKVMGGYWMLEGDLESRREHRRRRYRTAYDD